MVKVRFAPSPTGLLHLGGALSAAANRRFVDEHGGSFLLRIDDTDTARNLPGGEEAILRDLEWLRLAWDEGPARQSERADRHREAARTIGDEDEDGALRFGRTTLLRPDGSPTYPLATAVDDADFGITHVIRGSDHRDGAELHARLIKALGVAPPEFIHHGLLLGDDGKKLSKRDRVASLADLREAGIPPEAVRAYLDELGLPSHDVHVDLARIRRLSIDALAALSDEELAARVDAPVELAPALRGARDLAEAREAARQILEPEPVKLDEDARPTLARFRELRERANGALDRERAKELVRELKAVGGDLKSLRLALTGRERGPELWAIVAALPRDEALRRVDAAL
ncbi:MAG: glutamyl-tRNA synthetase [Gaiellaceae bacterium]|jgi:glutamyl/glutaminyl-tRNA synthetase|nr:glutamyl-tRNA synthetase [Gaiellaceae bacterium]